MYEIRKPIFILGSGRSGTTLLYTLLSKHPEVCWFSNITNVFPSTPQFSFIHRLLEVPFLRNVLDNSKVIHPSEGDLIYHWCGFSDDKKSTDQDVSQETRCKFIHQIQMHRQCTGKQRFLNKQTANTQRLQPLVAMFPDAYWIHIVRDGRAVVNSLLKTEWWLDTPIWWLGKTPRQWTESGGNPEALCAQHWKHNVMEIINKKPCFKDRYLQIYYEDLVKNPRNIVDFIITFCKLSQDEGYLDEIPSVLPDMNMKWKIELTKKQITEIEKESETLLHHFRYL